MFQKSKIPKLLVILTPILVVSLLIVGYFTWQNLVQKSQNSNLHSLFGQQNSNFNSSLFFDNNSKVKNLIQNPKPWLLVDNKYLLDQNNQLIIPAINNEVNGVNGNAFYNLKPIQTNEILYIPYVEGKIEIINIKKQTVDWVNLDFKIASMSLFGDKYYFTELNKDNCDFTQKHCDIWEIDKKTLQKRSIFQEMYIGGQKPSYGEFKQKLEFVDKDYFWLSERGTECFDGACAPPCASREIIKYDLKNAKFIEKYVIGNDCILYKTKSHNTSEEFNKNDFGYYDPTKEKYTYTAEIIAENKKCTAKLENYQPGIEDFSVECKGEDERLHQILNQQTYTPSSNIKILEKDKDVCGNFSYVKNGPNYIASYKGQSFADELWGSYDSNCIF